MSNIETEKAKTYREVKSIIDWMKDEERVGGIKVGYYATDKDTAPSRWACDVVRKEDVTKANERELWLAFGVDTTGVTHNAIWVNMRNGEITKSWGMVIGTLDHEILKMLVPLYNKHYLDGYKHYYERCLGWKKKGIDTPIDGAYGVHDEFNAIVNGQELESGSVYYRAWNDLEKHINCN